MTKTQINKFLDDAYNTAKNSKCTNETFMAYNEGYKQAILELKTAINGKEIKKWKQMLSQTSN